MRQGEDIKKGKVAVEAGTRLRPYHLAFLAALGNREVKVIEKPKIAIVATETNLPKAGTSAAQNRFGNPTASCSRVCATN
jgi:molybdopterin molybdotransferase